VTRVVDLRSDTVTRPTAGMRAAMAAAEVGDDVFGDDPSVQALQRRIAAILGKEAALFVPNGTQSILCAVIAHGKRGDEYLVGQMAHTYRWEGGGAAVLGSIQPQPLPQQADGSIALDDIRANIKPDDAHFARTRLLALENTWGGQCLPMEYIDEACALAHAHGLGTHLDGARLFNAAVASAGSGQPPLARVRDMAECFDSLSVCFSKGLGAPVGSLLCGSQAFIAQARRWRKVVGGGMRQVGLLAAAIDHALSHHVERLHDDHARAAQLAEGLRTVPGVRVRSVATNIVFIDVADGRGGELIAFLAERGILATGLIGLRMVTHLGIDDAAIATTVAAVRECLSRPPHNPT
jgi:threonine aldolase